MKLTLQADWQKGPEWAPDQSILTIGGYQADIDFRGDVWAWRVVVLDSSREIASGWVDYEYTAKAQAEEAIKKHAEQEQ